MPYCVAVPRRGARLRREIPVGRWLVFATPPDVDDLALGLRPLYRAEGVGIFHDRPLHVGATALTALDAIVLVHDYIARMRRGVTGG